MVTKRRAPAESDAGAGVDPQTWLQRWLPQWQFEEVHHLHSRASPAALLDAATAWRPDDDGWINTAMALREAPARLAGRLGLGGTLSQRPRFGKDDFVLLGRLGHQALAYGLVGRFFEPGYGLVPMADAQAFAAFAQPGVPKLLLAFEAEPASPRDAAGGLGSADGRTRGSRITTTTRLHCPDAAARRRMALYWAVIRPVSGLIRQRLLRQIRDIAERAEGA